MSDVTLPSTHPPSVPRDVIDRALAAAREMTGMDVAFIGQFAGDDQLIRHANGDARRFCIELHSGPALVDSYCQRMVDGRIGNLVADTSADPELRDLPVTADCHLGAYLGVPLELPDGRLYGALCCVSEDAATDLGGQHVELMRVLARLVGDQLGQMEAAELARQAQEEIFAAFGHDVRAPLAPIVGYAELLRLDRADDPRTIEAAEAILRNAQRLEAMLEDMLLLVRHRAHALEPTFADTDVPAVVAEAVADLASTARDHGIELHTDVPGEPVVLPADAGHLRRVVDNLVLNAIKFSREGDRVHVRIRPEADAVVLEVEDEGMGIPEDELPRLFDRFFRATPARGRIAGTGLGLSICQAVVQAHGGAIDVASEVGRGTTFTVRLPRGA